MLAFDTGCLAFEFGEFLPFATNDNSSGTVIRKYVHSTRDDDPQVWLEGVGNSDIRYVYANYQGSVVATTNAAGSTVQLYKYDPYGIPKDASNNDSWQGFRFRYTGQQILPEAKLYYYKARVYDPNLGIFLQTDPIGTKDDLNLYAYVKEDPINHSDPDGNGRVKLFVETVKGIWKRVIQKQAVNARKVGKNVDVKGPKSNKVSKSVEAEAQGGKNKVAKHDPHATSKGKGNKQPHYQPSKRASGDAGKGHTFYESAIGVAATASEVASDLRDNFTIDTGSPTLNGVIDFVNPVSDVSDLLDLGAGAITFGVNAVKGQ